ncbi:MAG: 30S ribosomal protein S17 [Planctomycetes bacterium RBG_13_46_10]|nr:MAG: 30S ribosomal protein S17 [Planctomycetes bacterium RBG_13_46_10]
MQERKLKTLTGRVISNSGNKSIRVAIDFIVRHPKYGKYIRRRTKLGVHDERNQAGSGDLVEIAQCRPYSKTKSWRLLKVVEKANLAEL